MVFTSPPLKHDLRDYNTRQGFNNDKKSLPPTFNIDTNEYIIRFRESISNLVNSREHYISYIIEKILFMTMSKQILVMKEYFKNI